MRHVHAVVTRAQVWCAELQKGQLATFSQLRAEFATVWLHVCMRVVACVTEVSVCPCVREDARAEETDDVRAGVCGWVRRGSVEDDAQAVILELASSIAASESAPEYDEIRPAWPCEQEWSQSCRVVCDGGSPEPHARPPFIPISQ